MRVLFINSSDISGGCGITAYRLGKGLNKYFNTENHFLVGSKQSGDENVFCTTSNKKQQVIEKIVDRITGKMGLQFQYFPFSTGAILRKVKQLKPDMIYLGNTHGGYFKTALIEELSKCAPVVWTLCDMWSFTGNCAHTFGDESWKRMKSGCNDKNIQPAIGINTGNWLLRQKKRIYGRSDFTVVAPSKWLCELAKNSPVFDGKEVLHIYSGFDTGVFRPKDKAACRAALDIPADARVVMCGAPNLATSPWKAGQHLIDILEHINNRVEDHIYLLLTGKGNLKDLKRMNRLIIRETGYIQSETILAAVYSAADLLIYPARAETLGNVLIESILCGTPAAVFDIGGCPEVIKNGTSGFVEKPFDIKGMSERVLQLLNDGASLAELSKKTRKYAEEKFNIKKMSSDYYGLFQRVAN